MPKFEANNIVKLDNFATHNGKTQSPVMELANLMTRFINRDKINYDQVRFALKIARQKTGLKSPKRDKKLPKMPSKKELRSFYRSIDNPTHKLPFEVLEGTGLRVAELTNLKVTNIDFDNNTIFVENGKGGKDRTAILGNKLKEKLQIYLDGRKNIYLFESKRNTKFSTRRLQQLCNHYCQISNINKKITCHTFRHLYITNLASKDIPREFREIVVGHSKNSKAHDIYLHLDIGSAKNSIINAIDGENTNEN